LPVIVLSLADFEEKRLTAEPGDDRGIRTARNIDELLAAEEDVLPFQGNPGGSGKNPQGPVHGGDSQNLPLE
jgi:hypothetical protein